MPVRDADILGRASRFGGILTIRFALLSATLATGDARMPLIEASAAAAAGLLLDSTAGGAKTVLSCRKKKIFKIKKRFKYSNLFGRREDCIRSGQ